MEKPGSACRALCSIPDIGLRPGIGRDASSLLDCAEQKRLNWRKMLELYSDLTQYLQRERHGPMPTYYFDLHTPREVVRDIVGSELACEASAREHAAGVARELMLHREAQTRSWRLDVRDGEGRRVFKLMLVTVDESLARFPPEVRSSLEDMCANNASLCDMIRTVRRTLHQVKGTMARADRLPYLTAI